MNSPPPLTGFLSDENLSHDNPFLFSSSVDSQTPKSLLSFTEQECFYLSNNGFTYNVDFNVMLKIICGFNHQIKEQFDIPLPVWIACYKMAYYKKKSLNKKTKYRLNKDYKDIEIILDKLKNNTAQKMKRKTKKTTEENRKDRKRKKDTDL